MRDHTSLAEVPPPSGNPTGWDPEQGWEHATLRRAVVHGVRLFNAGAFHDAHDCFEDEWYNYGQGRTESRFCHGMVQVAAAGLKRESGDPAGVDSLVGTALTYLRGVPADFYGVDVRAIRHVLKDAQSDPERFEDWQLTLDGDQPVAGPAEYAYVDGLE
jgi:predicted metal-dependent hydrolase